MQTVEEFIQEQARPRIEAEKKAADVLACFCYGSASAGREFRRRQATLNFCARLLDYVAATTGRSEAESLEEIQEFLNQRATAEDALAATQLASARRERVYLTKALAHAEASRYHVEEAKWAREFARQIGKRIVALAGRAV